MKHSMLKQIAQWATPAPEQTAEPQPEPVKSNRSIITTDDVLRIARAVASRYKSRCWWADKDDLTSEATRAVLEAKQTFDPQVGVPFDGYAARAATLQVRDYLWRQSSPLSGGLHDPRKNIAGVYSAELTEATHLAADDPNTELREMEFRLAVRDRLRQLAAASRDGDAAVEVLARNRPPKEVIRETGRDVYGAVHLMRRKARSDYRLYKLWNGEYK